MGNNSQSTKEQLCREAIRKMMLEAKKEASAEFKSFPDKVSKDLKYSSDDKEVIISRLLNDEYSKYDKIFDVNETAKLKAYLLKRYSKSKEIFDDDMNLNDFNYVGQKGKIIEQLLISKKIQYLEKLKTETQLTKIKPSVQKIKWLRGVSEFGYMILLLEEKGYIELPVGSTPEAAYEKLAKILFETFDVTKSWDSFKDSLSHARNRLGEVKRAKLEDFPEDFPDALQLGNLKIDNRKL